MGVSGRCKGIDVEISGVRVTGVGSAVCRRQGVGVHHNIRRLICVHAGRGRCRGGGPNKTSTTSSAAAPSTRGLLGALRFGPTCGSGAGGQHGHHYHEESSQED